MSASFNSSMAATPAPGYCASSVQRFSYPQPVPACLNLEFSSIWVINRADDAHSLAKLIFWRSTDYFVVQLLQIHAYRVLPPTDPLQ